VQIDLAVNPFDAEVPDMIRLAQAAAQRGASAVWVADHFSGAIVGRRWSRDPFVCLGAIAAATDGVDVGLLVANMMNRHPVQLAAAINTLQSVAPGRVRLGVGSGAAPGSRFASEHRAIGTRFGDAAERRAALIDTIVALRKIWVAEPEHIGHATTLDTSFRDLEGIVDGAAAPSIIVGASGWPTIALAVEHADGVNIRRTSELPALLSRLNEIRPEGFEVSVLDGFDDVVRAPERVVELATAGVDRLVIGVSPPHDPARLDLIDFSTCDVRTS
jgi:alkanesulfonate monooxygenase SsuD/methylene tetrahydromethanopterin reductase-like flavin-dependent oxidoreductase (luciferase family)